MSPNLRQVKYGLKKTALSLTDSTNCKKCKLKGGVAMPLYTHVPIKRIDAKEKIVVVLTDFARGGHSSLTDTELMLVNDALRGISVDRIYITPIVKCSHNKAPTKLMAECCEPLLKKELELLKPNVIVCLGKGPAVVFNVTGKSEAMRAGISEVTGIPGCKPKLVVTYDAAKVLGDISLRAEFYSAFKKAERFCNITELIAPENYNLIESPAEFEDWVDKIIRNKDKFVIAADIETDGRDMHGLNEDGSRVARMRCIGFSWAQGYAVCVPFEEDVAGYLPPLIRLFNSDVRFIGHNFRYDMSFMKVVYGIQVKNFIADTMLMAYLLSPEKGKYGYGLKNLAAEHTDLGAYASDVKDVEDEFDEETGLLLRTKWEMAPMLTLATYNCGDVDGCLQIFKLFLAELTKMRMMDAVSILAEASYVVVELECNGVLIDQEFVNETIPKLDTLLERYEVELTELAGASYDWNSPKVLGELLYTTLGYPNPYGPNFDSLPTDDEALDRIDTPFTKLFRKYRKASKLCGTYFKGYFSKTERDGRLRAEYHLCSTATGRTSSMSPNFQNLPRGMGKHDVGYEDMSAWKVKNAIIAPPGWTLVAAD